MFVYLDLFLILALLFGRANTNQCMLTGNLHALGVPGKRLTFDKSIGYMEGNDMMTCLRECMLRRKCEGIHYQGLGQYCELFYGGSIFTDVERLVYYNISLWPPTLFGTCGSRPCGLHEKCLPATPNHVCIPWCDGAINPVKGYPESPTGGPLNHVAVYQCVATYLPPPTRMTATCHEGNTWQTSLNWNCTEIRTCEDVQACDPTYTDGIYSVHDGIGGRVDIGCYNLSTLTPTTDFNVDPVAPVLEPECFR